MATQKHNAYYQSESGLYFYDEYGEKQEIEVNADSWKKYSDEHGSSGSKIYIGEGNSAYEGSVEIGSNNLGYHGGTILGDSNSAYNGSTIIGDRNWAVNGGGIFGEHNIGGKGGFVIGNDNKVKVWDNDTSSYNEVKQENVVQSDNATINSYILPNQVALGYNNNVNHGRGPYIGNFNVIPFQIGSYNEVLDSLSGYAMPGSTDSIGAAIYNIGKSNSSVNGGVNIGGYNLILTGDGSVGASINIGKNLVNRYGILIGQNLSSNGYSFNIGEYSTTEAGSFNFGERNYAGQGSYCIGKDITADNGSFNFGTNNTAGQGSMVLGESAFANRGSFCINKTGIGITGNINLASTADYGSMAIGCGNTAYGGGYAIGGKQSACGNSVAIGIKGNYNIAEELSLAIGFNNSATSNSMVVGQGNTALCHSYIFGADNSAAAQSVIFGIGNKDYVSNLNSHAEWINFFGRYNSVEGADDITNKNYQYNIIGDCNRLNLSGSQNAFGLIVGYDNRVNNHNANNIGGYNIIIGKENSGNCESINIGSNNETVGHSIGLGWNNTANTNSYAHTIMIGKANFADTNKSDLRPDKPFRVVDNGILTITSDNPETNNFIVGTNNSASHYNSIIIGSKNQTLSAVPNPDAEPGEELYDDDGFTVALGLGNIAARNYDMAIGYSTLASGGENIAIGAPQVDPDSDKLLWHTNAVGYRNLSLRSNIFGIGNIAKDSNVEFNQSIETPDVNKVVDNLMFNSTLTAIPGYNGINRNTFKYSNVNIEVVTDADYNDFENANNCILSAGVINENIIKNTDRANTFNINAENIVNNIFINLAAHQDVSISSMNAVTNNKINNSRIEVTAADFSRNIINHSVVSSDSATTFDSWWGNKPYSDNFLINTYAVNTNNTFSFGEGLGYNTYIKDTTHVFNFGSVNARKAAHLLNVGEQNSLYGLNESYIFGNFNQIYDGDITDEKNSKLANMLFVFGGKNYIKYNNATDAAGRITLFGLQNTACFKDNGIDLHIVGNNNLFSYINSADITQKINIKNLFDDYPIITYDENGSFGNYRNFINGNRNIISQMISNTYIDGDGNIVYTVNSGILYNGEIDTDESEYDNIHIIGNANLAGNGSNQLAIGFGNELSGHYAQAIGEELKANEFQTIIGKYNESAAGSIRFKYSKINGEVVENENSGIIFAIGNGLVKAYQDGKKYYTSNNVEITTSALSEEVNIERSNAMTVSANGTVSAGDFEISGCKLSDIINVVTLLKNKPASGQPYIMGLDNSGNLTWMNV